MRPRHISPTPLSEGYRLAHEIYGSNVERFERSVYDVTPDDVGTRRQSRLSYRRSLGAKRTR